jgi:cold shock CspA family protein
MEAQRSGVVKAIVRDRGFGFITARDGDEFFFHCSGAPELFATLQAGDRVTFVEEFSTVGPRARLVAIDGASR